MLKTVPAKPRRNYVKQRARDFMLKAGQNSLPIAIDTIFDKYSIIVMTVDEAEENAGMLCGDATSEDDLNLLMGDVKANLVVTDPPYNVAYESADGKSIQNDSILDASKGWGVAQRRRRIFAVLDLAGECAGKVLFESEGLSGYSPPRLETGKRTAGCTEESTGETGPAIVLNDQGGERIG